jgi:hypothetical protein
VTDLVVYVDKTTISNGGTDKAQITVVALDSSNNVVSGVPVAIAGDAGTVVTKASTQTDASGVLTATIGLGANKANRQIGATVSANGVSKSVAFAVIGTQLSISATPAVATPGQSVTLTITLRDSSGTTIPSTSVTFTGDIPALTGLYRNSTVVGVSDVVFAAPAADGIYNFSAKAAGVETQAQIRVAAGGSGSSIPDAVIPAGATPSIAISPTVLATNAVGSNINQATLRALFLTASNLPIPNVRVRFEIISTGLGSTDSSIGTGTNTVYTSASGTAFSTLISGQTNSPTNGVIVRACYSATDFATPSACPQFVTATMTIASQALGISIGEDGSLGKDTGVYVQQLAVTVVDSAGRAVVDAPVDISVDITHYGKGTFEQSVTFSLSSNAINQAIPDLTTDPSGFGARVLCPNEDFNRNGSVDVNENINGSVDSGGTNPTLEPRRADVLVSYATPGVTKTDVNGRLIIKVTYLQSVASWEVYRVRASTTVGGSQGMADRAFLTKFVTGDETPTGAPFRTPPYGFGPCDQSY